MEVWRGKVEGEEGGVRKRGEEECQKVRTGGEIELEGKV